MKKVEGSSPRLEREQGGGLPEQSEGRAGERTGRKGERKGERSESPEGGLTTELRSWLKGRKG